METKNICSVCAYRATCQKKYSLSGKDLRCPDFCRDIAVDRDSQEAQKQGGHE